MDSVVFMAAVFVLLGVTVAVAPEQLAKGALNSKEILRTLKQQPRATRRIARVLGAIFVLVGIGILVASRV